MQAAGGGHARAERAEDDNSGLWRGALGARLRSLVLDCLRLLRFGLAANKLEDSRAFSDQAGGDA